MWWLEDPDVPDPYDIPITLKVGVEHNIGRIRVRVIQHIWKHKPRFKLIGPATIERAPVYERTRRKRNERKMG